MGRGILFLPLVITLNQMTSGFAAPMALEKHTRWTMSAVAYHHLLWAAHMVGRGST